MGSENISGATKYFSGSIQMFMDYFTWSGQCKTQNHNCVLNSDHCADGAITDQLYNHGILAYLKWSHTKNLCMTIYKIWALTYIFWGDKKFYGDKDKFWVMRNNFWGGLGYKKIYGQPKNLQEQPKYLSSCKNVQAPV